MKKGKLWIALGVLSFVMIPNYVNASEIEVCADCTVKTISEAVTKASDGDVIKLKGETYSLEDITIDKNITIEGASKDISVIQLNKSVTNWITVSSSKKLTLKSVKLNGNKASYTLNNALYVEGSLDIQDAVLTGIQSAADNIGVGIYSTGAKSTGELTVKNVSMNDVEFAGIKLVDSTNDITTIIDNFTYVGKGTINDYRQYGIVIEDGRGARISNANISGCVNDGDSIGNSSSAIWVHGDDTAISDETFSCHEEILESYGTFTSSKCSEVTKVYIETSDLVDNSSSLYIGREEQDDASVVVRYSKLKKIYIRDDSYVDAMYNYWEGLDTLEEITGAVITSDEEDPTVNLHKNTNGFYTSASAAINKSPILDFALRQDSVEFELGKDYLIDDYVNINQNMFMDVTLGTESETNDFRLNVWNLLSGTSSDETVVKVDNATGNISVLKEGIATIKIDVTGFASKTLGVNILSGNPQTSDLPVIIVCFVGLIALGYGIYKLNKTKYEY